MSLSIQPTTRLGLNRIVELMEEFPDNVIGLSDHFNGISSGVVGFMKGARFLKSTSPG